ncbi:MAG TPA: hypothetical protein VG477_11000 [Thermoanaerobaculia bacterium]|nr:hypothetical protein [Thermoanaerobaculia bacterium]
MMRFLLRCAVLPVVLLAAAPAFAGWCALGPDGGTIQTLAVDPGDSRVVYASTQLAGRLYKTVDGGETWRLTGQGLPAGVFIRELAVDPRRPATVWAGTAIHGVYKSTDAGASWAASLPRRAGFDGSVLDLAVDPRTPDTVYAATTAGIFKTLNGGIRWRLKSRGLPNQIISVVEADPGRPGVVYAAGGLNGLYRTLNGGETWAPAGLRLPAQEAVTSLASTPGAVYAGTINGRLFKSTDRGATWLPASAGLPQQHAIVSLAIHPRTPRIVYAGFGNTFPADAPSVYRSGNGGASWTPVVTGLTGWPINKLAFGAPGVGLPGAPLYAATGMGTSTGGVFRSDDGRTWRHVAGGLSATWVRDIAVEPGDPGVLWSALLNPGLFRSGDGGRSWALVDLGEDVFNVFEVTADPRAPGTVYVLGMTPEGGRTVIILLKTTDSGGSWTRFDLPGGWPLKIDPRTGALFLPGGLYRSTDGGATWTPPVTDITAGISDVAFPDSPSSVIFAAGAQAGAGRFDPSEARVFRSDDGGATWTRSDAGLEGVQKITGILAVPGAPSTLVATNGAAMFLTTDAGATWRRTFGSGLESSIRSLLAAPDGTLYAISSYSEGVLTSRDGGATWTPFTPGPPPGIRFGELILDPDDPETLYAASQGGVQAFGPGVCPNPDF